MLPGPVGAVRAGERAGRRAGPSAAAAGRAEVCVPGQRGGPRPGGGRSTGGPAAGGDGQSTHCAFISMK